MAQVEAATPLVVRAQGQVQAAAQLCSSTVRFSVQAQIFGFRKSPTQATTVQPQPSISHVSQRNFAIEPGRKSTKPLCALSFVGGTAKKKEQAATVWRNLSATTFLPGRAAHVKSCMGPSPETRSRFFFAAPQLSVRVFI